MPRTVEDISGRIEAVTVSGFRGRLLARGFARNLVWSKGKVPEGNAHFSELLSSDLLSYGMGLLHLGLELRDLQPNHPSSLKAFGHAAEAIESVVRDGKPDFNERGFFTMIAAASYHLGHYSARAFSLFPGNAEALNLSPAENALIFLMKRDLTALRNMLFAASDGGSFDDKLAARLTAIEEKGDFEDALHLTLQAIYHQALAIFDFALDTGNSNDSKASINVLREGLAAAYDYGSVPFWWIFKITIHLLDDLWDQSFHVRLPQNPRGGDGEAWQNLRNVFITRLQQQDRAEIELWPSQLEAASRAVNLDDDLIAALPTSAGKTRIAELCILRTLSTKKRVVFVTPLRALSAQTEKALRHLFGPLGFTVSSLYGSCGCIGDDIDSLKNRDIVVSTPEKLDFALRSDPDILETVGLIVLDEAHTIGAGEREVRYEILVQRLLRRADADSRRIVCLSAILPKGDELHDFVQWIRQDEHGDALTVDWRPTRQRFGQIFPDKGAYTLWFRVDGAIDEDAPYVRPFIRPITPEDPEAETLPTDQRDLTILSAWKLVEEGQTVLIYCPERRRVMPMAKRVLELTGLKLIRSLYTDDKAQLEDALNIGREWLGEDHPAVQCLLIGVAVHHAHLPRPFLRAVEALLKARVLKVTIASPTLAQGLNLSATTVLFSSLERGRQPLKGEEFANVAGRAGRAFVDVEGQVLCVAWFKKDLTNWSVLLREAKERSLKSGLLQLIVEFCERISVKRGLTYDKVLEYVTGNALVWTAPKLAEPVTKEEKKEFADFEWKWNHDLACLDSALLSLVQNDVQIEDLAEALDVALRSSLWERSLTRETELTQRISEAILKRRANHIWTNSTPLQRKGYFSAGIGFATGKFLDANAEQLNRLLQLADDGLAEGDTANAVAALRSFAEIIFQVEPFAPDKLLDNWGEILNSWVMGNSMSDLAGGKDAKIIEFIEGALVYRLVWAMESVRVRRLAAEDAEELPNGGRAAVAVETGTSSLCASLLIQTGLSSRIAAVRAVAECNASFTDLQGLKNWLLSAGVKKAQSNPDWPTKETASIWRAFVDSLKASNFDKWTVQDWQCDVRWLNGEPEPGSQVRVSFNNDKQSMHVFSPELTFLGYLPYEFKTSPLGIAVGTVLDTPGKLHIRYAGPQDFFTAAA